MRPFAGVKMISSRDQQPVKQSEQNCELAGRELKAKGCKHVAVSMQLSLVSRCCTEMHGISPAKTHWRSTSTHKHTCKFMSTNTLVDIHMSSHPSTQTHKHAAPPACLKHFEAMFLWSAEVALSSSVYVLIPQWGTKRNWELAHPCESLMQFSSLFSRFSVL